MTHEKRPNIFDWLWPRLEFDFSKAPLLGRIIGTAIFWLVAVLAVGIIGALVAFIAAVFHLGPYQGQATDEAIRNIGLVLVAVFGAPFVAWRSWVAQRQAEIAEQGHITDRINKAVQGLGAEKTIRRQRTNRKGTLLFENQDTGNPDFKKPIFEEVTIPNLEVRIGSLYALERVANDSAADRAQIFEILCAYVSNNFDTPETYAQPPLILFDGEQKGPSLSERFRGGPDGLGRDWAMNLKYPRPDSRTAVSVVLRCIERFGSNENKGRIPVLSFTGANLQRADLRSANLSGATFEDCQLDGANLEGADLSHAKFINCSLIGASIYKAQLSGAEFRHSRLECVNAGNITEMSGCIFWTCDCSGIMFDGADLSGSHFSVTARKASFRAKKMNNTSFSMCDIRDGELSAHSMDRLTIHATWVPDTGVQLLERQQISGGASVTRVIKKVRLFAHQSNPHLASTHEFSTGFPGWKELEQGDAELIDLSP